MFSRNPIFPSNCWAGFASILQNLMYLAGSLGSPKEWHLSAAAMLCKLRQYWYKFYARYLIRTFPYTKCNYGHWQWADQITSSQAYSPKGKVCIFVSKWKSEWQSFQSCIRAAPTPDTWSSSLPKVTLYQQCQHYLFAFLFDCLMRSVSNCCCSRLNESSEKLHSIYCEREITRSQTGGERSFQVLARAKVGEAQEWVWHQFQLLFRELRFFSGIWRLIQGCRN